MPRPLARLATILTLSCAAVVPAGAHDFWIEPGNFRPAPGEEIGVRLRVGEKLAGDPLPRLAGQVVRFAAVGRGGEHALPGADGDEPAARWRAGEPGVYTLVYVSRGSYVELNPERFLAYLEHEGLDVARAAWQRRGETDVPARDRYARYAKALVSVGDSGADAGSTRPLGLELELVPEQNPCRLRPGSSLTLRLLLHGQPLAGAQVVARAQAHPETAETVRTDASGRAAVHLDRAGPWLVKAVQMQRAENDPLADWQSSWASLTFSLSER